MGLFFGRAVLPLFFVGACTFPEYTFTSPGGSGGAAGATAVPNSCTDGLPGPDETGIDCGGVCKACVDNTPKPVCADNMQGPDETGIDCGGVCPVCPVAQGCKTGADCESGSCTKNVCQAASCTDGVENGAESDIDCGGRCLVLCGNSKRCTAATDCLSGVCTRSTCQAPTCSDHVTNGTESGPDCGGKCAPCDLGVSCNTATDCTTQSCDAAQHLCVDPGCQDGTMNVMETDVDCGGPSCAPCAANLRCKGNSDCESTICDPASKRCDAASCFDAVINQGESDLNCGGTNCPACPIEKKCRVAADCASGVCQAKVCMPAKTGMKLDQRNWVAKASDTFGSSSAARSQALNNLIDGTPAIWTSGTKQYAKMYILLDMAKPQYFFTVTLDGTARPNDVGPAYNVYYTLTPPTASTPPSRSFASSIPVQPIDSDTVIYARYIKIELTMPGDQWWSVGEISVTQ